MSAFTAEAGGSQPFIGTIHMVPPPPSTWARLSAAARRIMSAARARANTGWTRMAEAVSAAAGRLGLIWRNVTAAVQAEGFVGAAKGYASLGRQVIKQSVGTKAAVGFFVTTPAGQRIIRGTGRLGLRAARWVVDHGTQLTSRALRKVGLNKQADQLLVRKGAAYAKVAQWAKHPRVQRVAQSLNAETSIPMQAGNWALGLFLANKAMKYFGVPTFLRRGIMTALTIFWEPFNKATSERIDAKVDAWQDRTCKRIHDWQAKNSGRTWKLGPISFVTRAPKQAEPTFEDLVAEFHESRGEKVVKVDEVIVVSGADSAAAKAARTAAAQRIVDEPGPITGVRGPNPGDQPHRGNRQTRRERQAAYERRQQERPARRASMADDGVDGFDPSIYNDEDVEAVFPGVTDASK